MMSVMFPRNLSSRVRAAHILRAIFHSSTAFVSSNLEMLRIKIGLAYLKPLILDHFQTVGSIRYKEHLGVGNVQIETVLLLGFP